MWLTGSVGTKCGFAAAVPMADFLKNVRSFEGGKVKKEVGLPRLHSIVDSIHQLIGEFAQIEVFHLSAHGNSHLNRLG